jgi:hypothetical protein
MAWSGSSIFRQYVADLVQGVVENQGATSMDWVEATTVKAALYDNDITPDNDVTAANTAYNAGQWTAAGNEVTDGTNWDTAGEPLTGRSVGVGTADTVILDATDTPQSGASTTLANVFGCLVYSDSITTPVADQGFCYNYFGGSQSVTAGNFTIVWHAQGVIRWTVTQA